MNEKKTGAIVSAIPDRRNGLAYKPLAFITGVPGNFTDNDLAGNIDMTLFNKVLEDTTHILFRADIHATSNEVQEEFEKLHSDSGKIPSFEFRQK